MLMFIKHRKFKLFLAKSVSYIMPTIQKIQATYPTTLSVT